MDPWSARELPRVGNAPGNGGGRRSKRAGEEGAAAGSLTTLEIPVRGAHRILAWLKTIPVHRDAHRASRLAPFGTRLAKNSVETLSLGLPFHLLGAGDNEGANAARELAALHRLRGHSQIGEPPVGAAADENEVDGVPKQLFA